MRSSARDVDQNPTVRRRPTISLIVMLVLGTLWCGALAFMQGDTTWEPWDRGWFAGWAVQFCVVGGVLVYLWHRSRAWMIVLAPIAIQLLAMLQWYAWDAVGVFQSEGDWEDSSTFADAFVPLALSTLLATAVVGYLAVRKSTPHGEV